MVPAHRAAHFQQPFIFVVEVHPRHFVGGESVASPSEVSATSAAESHVSHVVGIAHGHDAPLIFHVGPHHAFGISVFGSNGKVDVGHGALVHSFLDAEVECGFFVAIVDARHARKVALLVIDLDFVDDAGGQVFQSRLGVARHKLAPVNLNFLHLLAVDGNFSVVVDLSPGQTAYQFLHHRPFGSAVGSRVVNKGIFNHHHLQCLRCNGSLFQHHGIGGHGERAQVQVVAFHHFNTFQLCNVADAGDAQQVAPRVGDIQAEHARRVGGDSRHKGGVHFHELQVHELDGFLGVFIDDSARDVAGIFLRHCNGSNEREKE